MLTPKFKKMPFHQTLLVVQTDGHFSIIMLRILPLWAFLLKALRQKLGYIFRDRRLFQMFKLAYTGTLVKCPKSLLHLHGEFLKTTVEPSLNLNCYLCVSEAEELWLRPLRILLVSRLSPEESVGVLQPIYS